MSTKYEVWVSETDNNDHSEVVFAGDTYGEATAFIEGAMQFGTKERDVFSIAEKNEEA